MKKYLIIPARTQSEWDSVDAVVITEPDVFIQECKSLWKKAKEIGVDAVIMYRDYDFVCLDDNERLILLADDKAEIHELPDTFLDTVARPEQNIGNGNLKVYASGIVSVVGYGKHTDEEFWASINLDDYEHQSS